MSSSSDYSLKGKKLTLYSYWRSSCSWRVRVALALKGLQYEYIAVPLLKNAQSTDEYTKLNPNQVIPTLVIADINGSNEVSIHQSLAIIDFLDAAVPDQGRVLPTNALARAKVLEIAHVIASDTQPIQNLRVLNYVAKEFKPEAKMPWGKYWISRGLEAVEKQVCKTSGKYCVGDEVTLVDLCLIPQLFNARRFSCDMSLFPTLVEVEKRLSELEAFKAAHPDVQPDAGEGDPNFKKQ